MSKKYPEFEHTLHSMPLNTLVKIVYKYEWRNKAERFIGSLNKVDDRFCYYEFGHPYFIDKDFMESGRMGVRFEEIYGVFPVTREEADKWVEEYKKFHDSVLKVKGYDTCEEELNTLKLYKGRAFFEKGYEKL